MRSVFVMLIVSCVTFVWCPRVGGMLQVLEETKPKTNGVNSEAKPFAVAAAQ